MTLRLMMMHHNTKFGNQMFGGLENIIWANMDSLTLRFEVVWFFFMLCLKTLTGSKGKVIWEI